MVIAKIQVLETFVASTLVGFCSLFEWGSWITLLIMQLTQSTIDDLQTDFVLFGLVLNYLFNIFYYFYIYKKKILKDTDY